MGEDLAGPGLDADGVEHGPAAAVDPDTDGLGDRLPRCGGRQRTASALTVAAGAGVVVAVRRRATGS
ncbi:hypothetical protein ACIOMM_13765 [Streptomyces sp. NPDC087908]|uniref:hypothetical protein n=1 Tax=Streptomyces sp. NPDC087908 TaxID=3365820 RepID=UPI0037F1665A